MKHIVATLLFSTFSLFVQAQKKEHSSVSKIINDDGKTLTLTIDASFNNHKVYFTNTYDVVGLNQKQKDALVKRVTDSLAIPVNRRVIKL